jgi:hypothetical protein
MEDEDRVEAVHPEPTLPGVSRRSALGRIAAAALALLHRPAWASVDPSPALVPWDEAFEVAISFRIGDPRNVNARRPYVAVFIEDPNGKAVRTITLWAQKQIAWLRHLRHWYRGELARQSEKGGNLVTTLTSATRRAGEYTVVWDGRDDDRKLVEQGEYFVCIESVRQGGSSHLVRESVQFGVAPFKTSLDDFADIQQVTVEMRRKG